MELEAEFGECSYDVKDFDEMAEAYYVFVNPYFQQEGTNEKLRREAEDEMYASGDYIATIFADSNGKLYYCNQNNPISNEMTQKINAILKEGNMFGE